MNTTQPRPFAPRFSMPRVGFALPLSRCGTPGGMALNAPQTLGLIGPNLAEQVALVRRMFFFLAGVTFLIQQYRIGNIDLSSVTLRIILYAHKLIGRSLFSGNCSPKYRRICSLGIATISQYISGRYSLKIRLLASSVFKVKLKKVVLTTVLYFQSSFDFTNHASLPDSCCVGGHSPSNYCSPRRRPRA
jgi:hypothetical protein